MLSRSKRGIIGRWWWSIDRVSFAMTLTLLAVSAVTVTAASPAVAERIGVESFYFIRRQLIFLCGAFVIMSTLSFCNPIIIRRLAILGFIGCIMALIAVFFWGYEIKGAKRWLYIAGFSLQPSEMIKPCFAIVIGWVLSLRITYPKLPIFKIAIALYVTVASLLILQPDFGMTVTISLILGGQLFLMALPIGWIIAGAVLSVLAVIAAYSLLPHVTARIDNFLNPESAENYQVRRSLEAFQNGGFYGQGPGEGTVKQLLPDSHTDFIFAVIGEEFGLIACALVLLTYGVIVIRSLIRLAKEQELFIVLAGSGIIIQFGIQALINIGVTLHLLPTKGMTLPFISYGGSSMLATAITLGTLLALTRKQYGHVRWNSDPLLQNKHSLALKH